MVNETTKSQTPESQPKSNAPVHTGGNLVGTGRNSNDRGNIRPLIGAAHPVPHLSIVHPVPRLGSTAGRASGSTDEKKEGSTSKAHPVPQRDKPPSFTGYKWKPSGLTGWELYTRKPSVSINGKRSSTGKYLGYYSKEAIKVLYEAREKTANSRRA